MSATFWRIVATLFVLIHPGYANCSKVTTHFNCDHSKEPTMTNEVNAQGLKWLHTWTVNSQKFWFSTLFEMTINKTFCPIKRKILYCYNFQAITSLLEDKNVLKVCKHKFNLIKFWYNRVLFSALLHCWYIYKLWHWINNQE